MKLCLRLDFVMSVEFVEGSGDERQRELDLSIEIPMTGSYTFSANDGEVGKGYIQDIGNLSDAPSMS
jgi:hypothetical protein